MPRTTDAALKGEHLHFVTGRLAENGLRQVVAQLAIDLQFDYSIDVMPITVAALLTPRWIADRINVAPTATRIILPGYCEGDLSPLRHAIKIPIEIGPKDYRALPEFLGGKRLDSDLDEYSIEIIAEINHAPRMPVAELVSEAKRLRENGADIIDIGCEPGEFWLQVADGVRAVCDAGLRVSIDSMNSREIEFAVKAGAELVLSVNSTNREAAPDWACEVVVIPDDFTTLGRLDETIAYLAERGVPLRIDPILEPIGCGFAGSLRRYMNVRERYPDAEMMMGIGNLTELTDVDSAGINVLLMAICEDLRIRSVLTTQVINWARTSVQECDVARRLVHYAVRNQSVPKHVDDRLIMLRDAKLYPVSQDSISELQHQLKDHNYRIFAESERLHLLNADVYLSDTDPFELFRALLREQPKNLDASHAFYLGYELCKAVTALTLGKQYRQDEALNWGLLTRPEKPHRNKNK